MKFLDRWRFGAAAVDVAEAVRKLIGRIDARAALEVAAQILILELGKPQPGEEKWLALARWFTAAYPQYEKWVDLIRLLVDASVKLFKALGLFQSKVNASEPDRGTPA